MTVEPAAADGRTRRERVRVRPLRRDDLGWTAPLQQEALPHGFFTRLGPRFLRAYQGTFLDSPHGIALAADEDGSPAGFLVGAVAADAHRAWVVRHRRVRLAALGAACLVRRPRELVRFPARGSATTCGRSRPAADGRSTETGPRSRSPRPC